MKEFEFLRSKPVDILTYLPESLQGDSEFKRLQDTLSWEHERYRLKLIEIARRYFVETADLEGLKAWEKFLKIKPSGEIEIRRSVIRAKRRGDTTMTVAQTQRLLESFAPFGEVSIEELGANRLKFNIKNGNFHWDELLQALFEQLPAHLIFDFKIDLSKDSPLIIGQIIQISKGEKINLGITEPKPSKINISQQILIAKNESVGIADIVKKFTFEPKIGLIIREFERLKVGVDSGEYGDDYKQAMFEKYLRRKWNDFKNNAVIKRYGHNLDGEIDSPDEPEYFPVQSDFLRIYWDFGSDCSHFRYQTILDPADNLTAADIRKLSNIGVKGKILLHSKSKIPTTGIVKALYIRKSETKLI